jgi:methylthioribose-1-phosphate isomerase
VPIEQRAGTEVSQVIGKLPSGEIGHVTIAPEGTEIVNYAFDVTPARLITGLITEAAIVEATESKLTSTFPEHSLNLT